MAIQTKRNEDFDEVGTWQTTYRRSNSPRVVQCQKRVHSQPEFCLERARVEMKVLEETKGEPRIIQRAKIFAEYVRTKTICIRDGDLIVGNFVSKVRGAAVFGELHADLLDKELDDPVKDFAIRPWDTFKIYPNERKELREKIIPYFKGKTLQSYVLSKADDETKEKAMITISSCSHIPNLGDIKIGQDSGHTIVCYKKILQIGLTGIRDEVKWRLKEATAPYHNFIDEERKNFYEATLICLDAAIEFGQRYSKLAREMAAKEADPQRRAELEKIAEVCARVPAYPARNWWEALQSVMFVYNLLLCEMVNVANSFGRFDQWMYPYYKMSVLDGKMNREEALELLELFWVKLNEFVSLYDYANAQVQGGFGVDINTLLGGSTPDGKDATNEVSYLCLDAEEHTQVKEPDPAIRVWEGSPQEFLKRALEVARLGRGKPKFFGERAALAKLRKGHPDLADEVLKNFAVVGCVELCLPEVTQNHSFVGLTNVAKIAELVLTNGRCAICGKQIGPMTGDPRKFESFEAVREAFKTQNYYWMEYMCKAIKHEWDGQLKMMPCPFTSSILEGPLDKGKDLIAGGCWYTLYGLFIIGLANAADTLCAVDKLIYRDKKVTWEQLLQALKDNWNGHEELRQLFINGVPKYGNDDDYADSFAAFVVDAYADAIDWANQQKALVPEVGGEYRGSIIVGAGPTGLGAVVGALPCGHINPHPLADTMSPIQGYDRHGPTAVIKSVSKIPQHRLAMGCTLNQRLSPSLVATDEDLDRFVAFLRAFEELGLFHIQFNVVSSELLRKAMKEPDSYRDLLIRVASYVSYFVELDAKTQLDIIARTEQQQWSR